MEFGPMSVQVKVLVSSQPSQKDVDSMKAAAAELTNNRRGITVIVQQGDLYYELVTEFTMRRTAQYKVVDDIAHQFEFHSWDLEDYQDMIISFPKTAAEIDRQNRKNQKQKPKN